MKPLTLLWCAFFAAAGLFCRAAAQQTDPLSHPSKILFLGNSITLHGPNPKIGWPGNWGMAASAADKDFVHLVTRALSDPARGAPAILVKNISAFERDYAQYDVQTQLKDAREFGADLIVLAIGENVPAVKDDAKPLFRQSLQRLLAFLRGDNHPVVIVRSCFWANPAKDEALRLACQDVGGRFVNIGQLSRDESNFARSERPFSHTGVAAHPGDKGMQMIATAILDAFRHP